MPVLPGVQQRLNPEPSSTVAQYTGGIAENAEIAQGQALTKAGGEIIQMADKRRDELDDLRVVEAATDLRNRELKLTEEYKAIKGGDVIKAKLLPTYAAKFKAASDEISFGLSSAQQKKFAPHVATASGNFQASAMGYSIHESEVYAGTVFEKDLESRVGAAAATFMDDRQINLQRDGGRAMVLARMDTLGLKDGTVRDETAKATLGAINEGVIHAALNAGNTARANEYFNRPDVQREMTQKQIEETQKMLKPATDFAAGKVIADSVYSMWQKDKTINTAEYVAEMAKGNPQIAERAHMLVAQYQQAQHSINQENKGSALLVFQKSGADASAQSKMFSSKEFRGLPPSDQASVIDHTNALIHQAVREYRADANFTRSENRYDAQIAKAAEQERKAANVGMAVDLAENPKVLKEMTPQKWAALELDVDPKHIAELKREQQRLIKGVARHDVDPDQFKAAVANLPKAQQATVKALAELYIASEQESTGKPLDAAGQARVIRRAIDEATPKNQESFHTGGEVPLYKLPPEKALFFSALMGNFPDKTQYNQAWMEQMYGDQTKDVSKRAATMSILQSAQRKGVHLNIDELNAAVGKKLATPAPTAAPTAAPTSTGNENLVTPSARPTGGKGLPDGMIAAGTIDLAKRQVVHNADGSISTELSKGFSIDGRNVLIPTVIDGKIVSDTEAIAHYRATWENLGEFSSDAASDRYAEMLHKDQEKRYANQAKPVTATPAPENVAKEEARKKEIISLEKVERARIAAEVKQKAEAKQKAESQVQQLLEANTLLAAAKQKANESAPTPAPVKAKGLTQNQAQQLLEANTLLDAARGKGETARKEAVNKVSDQLSHELLLKLLDQRISQSQKKAGK